MVDMGKYTDDADRIAETLFQVDFKGNIKDRESFDSALDSYLENAFELRESDKFRNMVFQSFTSEHPERITDKENLFRDEARKPKPRPKIKREFRHLGKVGKQIVFLRKAYVETPKGTRLLFRDKKGRLGTVKK